MSDDRTAVTAEHEEEVAGKEETASAAEVIHGMLKTAKAFRMYLPNNPLLQRFVDETCTKTVDHIARYGDYRLDVEQFDLRYRGNKVYENRDPKESLAFRMFSDGIRSFSFHEGIGQAEICTVLDILGRERVADSDDDIVTLLWLKDLSHVSYVLTDEILSMDLGGAVFSPARSQGESIKRVYEEEPLAGPVPVHRELHVLTPEETATLRAEREAEEKKNAHHEVTTIISSILAGENDPQIVGDFLAIMENLIANLIRARQPVEALRLIRFLRKIAASDKVPPAKREQVQKTLGSGIDAETVVAFLPALETPDGLLAEDVAEFLTFFGSRHIGAMCELLARVQQMKMRKALLAGLIQVGPEAPAAFFPFLSDKRWFLVRNIVFILGHIGGTQSLEAVLRVAGHQDLRVRKEVLGYLQKLPEPRARMGLVRFLQDENVHLRIRAMQVLAAAKFAPALKALESMVAVKDFPEWPLQERRAIFEALGELAGDGLLPRLRGMMKKRLLMGRAREKDDVTCAVAALRKIGTPAAVALLEEAEAERRGTEIGTMISDVLRVLRPDRAGA